MKRGGFPATVCERGQCDVKIWQIRVPLAFPFKADNTSIAVVFQNPEYITCGELTFAWQNVAVWVAGGRDRNAVFDMDMFDH